jgi:hypothetical protein
MILEDSWAWKRKSLAAATARPWETAVVATNGFNITDSLPYARETFTPSNVAQGCVCMEETTRDDYRRV